MRIKHWKAKAVTGLMLAVSLVLPQTAFAGDGGAGSAGGGTGTGTGGKIVWTYADSYGAPTEAGVLAALADTSHGKSQNITLYDDASHPAHATIGTALQNAVGECQSRYATRHGGSTAGADCRLVGVGAVETDNQYTGSTGGFSQDSWLAAYNASGIPQTTYLHEGAAYTTAQQFTNSADSVNSLVQRETAHSPSIVVVVLSADEPPVNYDLTVDTAQQGGFAVSNGVEDVFDHVDTHNQLKANEDLSATLRLHWDAMDSTQDAKSVSKDFTVGSQSSTDAPHFSPQDFGWKTWAAGTFWYDVTVAKQGHMKDAVDTSDREKTEMWEATPPPPTKKLTDTSGSELTPAQVQSSAMPYYAVVQASTAGAESMTLSDTVETEDVWFGGTEADVLTDDSTIWVDVDGQKVPASISVDDSTDGKRTLNATVDATTKDVVGTVTLHVLTAAKPNGKQTLMKDQGTVCWDGSHCQTSDHRETTKVTPTPDKAWVLNQEGALATSDEKWTNKEGADTFTFLPGDPISAVVNGTFPKNLSEALDSYELVDDWTKAAPYVDFSDPTAARVFVDGVDRTSSFEISTKGTTTVAKAKPEELEGTVHLNASKKVKLVVSGSLRTDYTTGGKVSEAIVNAGWESWNNEHKPTNDPPIFTWTPVLDKVWIRKNAQGKWESTIDPEKTNKHGADSKIFLDGDTVAAQVNGLVPAHLGEAPSKLEFVDDFEHADYLVDVAQPDQIKIFEADVDTTERSSEQQILSEGTDVTSQFEVAIEGTKVRVSVKDEYRASLVNLDRGKQLSILIPFTLNYANGGGAAQVRSDFGAEASDQVSFCSNPVSGSNDGQEFINTSSETISEGTAESNQPHICGFVPPAKKEVISEASQGGDQSDIDSKIVAHGQKVEYKLSTSFTVPKDLALKISDVAINDNYSAYTTADKQTLEITNLADGSIVPKSEYSTAWKETTHSFTTTFDQQWVNEHFTPGQSVNLMVRFEARVNADAPLTKTIDNEWSLKLNNSVTPSNKVSNRPQEVNPNKDVTAKEGSVSIDGKTLTLGSAAEYRITLDAEELHDSAYKVQRLGLIDDYDEEYLSVNSASIRMLDASGNDVTDKFNVSVDGAVAYAYFKTVDTLIPATSVTVPGNPQPSNLEEYGRKVLNPLTDPAVDQSVLGQKYTMVMPFTVIKVKDGYEVVNTATQITNSDSKKTNTVVNPLKDTTPRIDVEKFDASSGFEKGDRDSEKEALMLDSDTVDVVFRITNTGKVSLHHLELSDSTTKGTGQVKTIDYPVGWEALELKPGDHIDIPATVSGIRPGSDHTDNVIVTGVPQIECPVSNGTDESETETESESKSPKTCDGTPLHDSDPWNARRSAPLAVTGTDVTGPGAAGAFMVTMGLVLLIGAKRRSSVRPTHKAEKR